MLIMTPSPLRQAHAASDRVDQQQRHGHQGWQLLRLALPPT
ncbi:hypothetical protein SynBOUM118_00380 [Synechococcus sp. BOUM118]|nr:hypothetical protein SynBOUM118_00380 [Synechococcus sp. BOUM118]